MLSMKTSLRFLLPLGMLACAPVMAQGYGQYGQHYSGRGYDYRPVQWFVDVGPSIPVGRTADFLNTGITLGTGVTFTPQPGSPFKLRAEVDYSRYNATRNLISLGEAVNQVQIDDGTGQVISGQINGVLEAPVGPAVRLYATAGVGVAYRRIELTQRVVYGGWYCDPWVGWCQPDYAPGDLLVASYDTTRFAWNAGAGIDFALPGGQSWFIEARYERIETQEPTTFVPIRIGMRF
ncbi:MAG: outer membrane beta-barrel protein [Proteobacteria bacterium]|nr:outer membrane beta-barrel protein [Pseudomonadota bacterium]